MTDDKRPSLREPAHTPPPRRPKPPVVGVEQVTVRCGHTVPFELFDPKKDKFRNDRRKKLTDRACSACRIKAQQEKEAAEREEARQRRAAKPKPEAKVKERLPHGSRYDVRFDAAAGAWSGTLTVPAGTPDGTPLLFSESASAVFKLLRRLDAQYRAALAAAGSGAPDADASRDVGGEG